MRSSIACLLLSVAAGSNLFFNEEFNDDYVETCWVKAYGRGVGKIPDYCDPDTM